MAGSASATTRPKERCGASHWEGATGPSPAPNAAPTAPPSCSPSSPPHASTTSTQKPGSPTSSLASPIFPPRVCTNCCPGNGSACAKPTCPPISRPPEPLAPHHKPASARAPATIPRPCPCEYALRWCRRFSPTAGSPSRSHGEVDSDRHFGRVRLLPPTLEATMQTVADRPPTAIRTDLGAIFVSLERSRSTWLITSLSPGGGEKISKQVVRGGDVAELLERFARLREKARARTGKVFPFVVIQEAGLDGFWIDRALQNEGIESHVVDPASIATSRRRRRAKNDGIDGEALVRALLAYKRGEPRVCAMVKAPTPEEEDRRRLCRERKVLIGERVQHVNRVKGLLFSQGISGYEPLRRDRRERLDTLQTGDGRLLPDHLKAQVCRELDRLELLLEQIKAVA